MIGLLPAAGAAERMHGLPKFLLPVGDTYLIKRHVELIRAAGGYPVYIPTLQLYVDLLKSRWKEADIFAPKHIKTMSETVLNAYHLLLAPSIMPTLFGMPDTYIEDDAVYHKLAAAIAGGADVAVALFEARPGQYWGGMCRVDGTQVADVKDKPGMPIDEYPYIWGALAWQPSFWQHIIAIDPHVGYALPRAIHAGADVRAVVCEGRYYDCGTPFEYFQCIREVTDYARAY